MHPDKKNSKDRTLKDYLGLTARGFMMGSADVVPGVSGGTMAFILGIYEELLEAISALNSTFLRRLLRLRIREALADFPWHFLLAVGLGILTAILTLARLLSYSLENHPTLVWGFFFGLVLGSILAVRGRVKRWTPPVIAALIASAVALYLIVGLAPHETSNAPWFVFLSGMMASAGMLLPGISGAFILVLLGKYEYALNAVVNRDFVALAILAAGAAAGILSIARLLRWMFGRYHDLTVAALIGLMIGSLRKVWPWKEIVAGDTGHLDTALVANVLPDVLAPDVALTIGLGILGFGVVAAMDVVAGRQEQPAGKAGRAERDSLPSLS